MTEIENCVLDIVKEYGYIQALQLELKVTSRLGVKSSFKEIYRTIGQMEKDNKIKMPGVELAYVLGTDTSYDNEGP